LNVGLQAGILLDEYRMFNNKNHSTRFDKLGILQSGHFLVIPESSAFRRAIIKGKGLFLTGTAVRCSKKRTFVAN